jgi:hypothetical protein
MVMKRIEDSLSNKEIELANLVDFFNDTFLDSKRGKKKASQLQAIILNLVEALNAESKNTYKAEYLSAMCLWKNGEPISNRAFYDALRAREKGQPYKKELLVEACGH